MTSLPDWLVERAALEEVPPASRERIERADARELADRIAALRADNAVELAAYPAGPAVAQLQARVAKERAARRRRQRLAWLSAASAAALVVLVVFAFNRQAQIHGSIEADEITRVKGATRLAVFRQTADGSERLDKDAIVRAGDVLQIRYRAGGRYYGVIASLDGAGVVTLHYPATEDSDTALLAKPTSLPNAYVLDDAPRFERFFFITADEPIAVAPTLEAIRALAQRADRETATLELPASLRQWSLCLRKPSNPKAPTP